MQFNDTQFFSHDGEQPLEEGSLPEGLSLRIWKPSRLQYKPKEVSFHPKFIVWWVFHHLHVFYNRRYALLIISKGNDLAHYSFIFPGYFRFGFMQKDDLQIGDIWTSPNYRKRGLATFAIKHIVTQMASPATSIWYLVEEENIASIRAVEKARFNLTGKGIRVKRLGLRIFGQYQITKQV